MEEIISGSVASQRFSMVLLAAFAALALLLSSIGIYGVVSYLVGQQTREIGLRLALGAQRRDVLRLILGSGAKSALLGVAIGIVAALGLTRLTRGIALWRNRYRPVDVYRGRADLRAGGARRLLLARAPRHAR